MQHKDEQDAREHPPQDYSIDVTQRGEKSASLIGDHPQVFQVNGDLYYQSPKPKKEPQTLFPLYPVPDPGIFVDRKELLQQMERFFRSDPEKVFFLEGMGGIGKTAFVAYTCQKFQPAFHDIYWGICTEESTVERFLEELYSFLMRNEDTIPEDSWDDILLSLSGRIQMILQKLATHKYLLVFDDFHRLLDQDGRVRNPELEGFFQEFILAKHQSKILLLSRRSIVFWRQPAGVSVRSRITGLEELPTKQLLLKLGMKVTSKQVQALYRRIGGHPLALRIIADLYQRGIRIDKLLTMPFCKLCRESEELFNDLFAELWHMLQPEEIEVLQCLSTYRVPVPLQAIQAFQKKSLDAKEADSLAGILQEVVQVLRENCLVQVKQDEHQQYLYTVPGIIREFVFKELTKAQQHEYHLRAATYWLSLEWAKKTAGYEGLQEKEEARYHCFQAEEYEQATHLALSLAEQLNNHGLYHMARETLLKAKETVFSEEDLATIYNKLGKVSICQKDYTQASKYYEQARELMIDERSLASLKHLIRRQGIDWLQASVEILAPPDETTFITRLYREIEQILRRFEETANLRQKDLENRLNTDLVLLLRQRGYNALREEDQRGHTDILVCQDQYRWLGEGKIHRAYKDLFKGLRQLHTRYTTGRERHIGLIIYILNQNAKQVMRTWRKYLDKYLACGLKETGDDPENALAFWSVHQHKGSGLELFTKHIGVALFYAPEDN
ncbi:hypothetical protein GF339_17095 [candidate division KSB3 bacterium]|uniref:NB-ARC domain-containing protein n=1 Tax=candidate division KSB3 bacterium TaxID=2044937 RepID=A0A9D5JY76_9BACT|nr:hypothetical protein [candidate division KSB3 bacterium]MBD3326305.1 hypothetical protein [candidate division KSB3 bacterium]